MLPRKLQSNEYAMTAVSVAVACTMQFNQRVDSRHIKWAFDQICVLYPILTSVVVRDTSGVAHFVENVGGKEAVNKLLVIQNPSTGIPTKKSIEKKLSDEARRPMDVTSRLFAIHVDVYEDLLVLFLVVSHAITDGTSIFGIVDTFCHHLSTSPAEIVAPYFPVSHRNLTSELLADPRCRSVPDPRFSEDCAKQLPLPKLTEGTWDKEHNGCMRVVFYEFDSATTASILANCRKNLVSFQALLSAISGLALVPALQKAHEMDSNWDKSVFQYCPLNARRYLHTSDQSPADRISASCSAGVWWKTDPFRNENTLAARLFWSDLVNRDCYQRMQACIASDYPLQTIHRGQTGEFCNPYTMAACSIGNITTVKPHYGSSTSTTTTTTTTTGTSSSTSTNTHPTNITVQDVLFQVSLCAPSQDHWEHPMLSEAMAAHPMLMLHAYTIHGRLKISGEYVGYSEAFASGFYDEIVRMVRKVGSEQGASETLRVGDVLQFI